MKYFVAFACTAVAAILVAGAGASATGDKDKKEGKSLTIKEVMQKAHGGGKKALIAKFGAGTADKKDAETLLDLYSNLAKAESPKGEAADWKTKTEALVAAAKDLVAGKEGAAAKLQEASNCAGCHKIHKGKKAG